MSCADSSDQFFLYINGALVFFLQAGFGMLEVGSVRSKNATNILFKNVMDVVLGAMAWFFFGYAFAFGGSEGDNEFIGTSGFFLNDVASCDYAFWFFQWTFAATATTIISGAVAERCQISAYVTYSLIVTGVIYPVVVYWTWSNNAWLTKEGYSDFAGSGIVHSTGGMAALMGAYFIGPRIGRFDTPGKVGENFPGNSLPLATLGTMILIFGFFAFNGGSVLAISGPDDGAAVATAVVNTVLAAAGGGFAALIGHHHFSSKVTVWSLKRTMNGIIGGMVAICAGAGGVKPWAGLIIGVVAGFTYLIWSNLMRKLKIDDPLDAIAVHLGCGIWGVVAEALFAYDTGVFYKFDGDAWEHLGWNVCGVVVICIWVGATSGLMFFTLNKLGSLRVTEAVELTGLDLIEHGEPAYVHGNKANISTEMV